MACNSVYVLSVLNFYDDKQSNADIDIYGVYDTIEDAQIDACQSIEQHIEELYSENLIPIETYKMFKSNIASNDTKFNIYSDIIQKKVNVPVKSLKSGRYWYINKVNYFKSQLPKPRPVQTSYVRSGFSIQEKFN